jgi:hypothetical protein
MQDQCANFSEVPTPAPSNTPQTPTSTPQVPTNTPQAPTQTPVDDKEPPTVRWIAPVPATERYNVREGAEVALEAEARDNASIKQVVFIRWDAVNLQYVTIGTVDQAPYRITINASTINPEWNQVFVTASDVAGNNSDSPYIWLYKFSNLIFLPYAGK